METTREDIDIERLSQYLKTLANPNRLELLWILRIPTAVPDIHLTPKRRDENLSPARAISRQSVLEHVESLEEVGLVDRLPEEGVKARRVINQARLFAIIEDLRALTAIRPSVRVDVDATLASATPAASLWPEGPRLVLASGPWEGRAFALEGAGPWHVGRSRQREISLAYDPFVSAEHATLHLEGGGYVLEPAAGVRNPLRVNLAPLHPGERRRLRAGDLVHVGRSLLVAQDM